jgi:hypothetical protein
MDVFFPRHAIVIAVFAIGLCLTETPAHGQASTSTAVDVTSLVGSWTLNREASTTTFAPDVQGRRAGVRRGGFGGGFGGGRGAGRGGAGQTEDAGADARAERQRLTAVMQELVTPSTHLLIRRDDDGALAMTDADGRTVRYVVNNKVEKHQLTNGTIETRSRWDHGELRQDVNASDAIALSRSMAIDRSTTQLVLTTTMAGGRGNRERPFRAVYDRDED